MPRAMSIHEAICPERAASDAVENNTRRPDRKHKAASAMALQHPRVAAAAPPWVLLPRDRVQRRACALVRCAVQILPTRVQEVHFARPQALLVAASLGLIMNYGRIGARRGDRLEAVSR